MSRETVENSSPQGKCPCDCFPIEVLAQLSHLKQLVKNADRKKVIDSGIQYLEGVNENLQDQIDDLKRELLFLPDAGEWLLAAKDLTQHLLIIEMVLHPLHVLICLVPFARNEDNIPLLGK